MPRPTVLLFLPLAFACPDFWIPSGASCYKTSPGPLDWYEAQQYFPLEGGYLSEIRDENEQASLASFLSTDQCYWMGLTDLAQEGNFVWQSDFQAPNYTHWGEGQPNENGGESPEDCAHLSLNFYWNDLDCFRTEISGINLHALCEASNEDFHQ